MQFVAKVFKNGDSLAEQLPSELKVRSKELYIESGRDGDLVLFDPKTRERAWQKRMKAFDELIKNPPLGPDDEFERF